MRRYYEHNVPYFVTTVTNDRAPLFKSERLCRILLVTIEYHKTIFDFSVQGYCVMPDHVHLILTCFGKFNLSYIMKMIKGSFARKVNKLNNKEGSCWQQRFYDEAIRNEAQLFNQLDYIHMNPVKAGLVNDPIDYPFSSFRQYQKDGNPNSPVLEIEPLA
jgi:putative transposase